MKFILILIKISLLVVLTNGHGYLSDPMNRGGKNGNQHSDRFYFTSGDFHICGNTGPNFAQINHGWSSVYIPNTQLTGPIQRIYKSGSKFTMTSTFYSMHDGLIKVMLCKLKSAADVPTQACFDQQLLKISVSNVSRAVNFDDYTVRTSAANINPGNGWLNTWLSFDPPLTFNITVELPAGLTCENCVLQWKWNIHRPLDMPAFKCLQADTGKDVPIQKDTDFERFEDSCLTWTWRNCADIKIEATADSSTHVYQTNPIKAPKAWPKTFTCPNATILNIKYPYSEKSYFNTMQDIIPPRTTDKYKYTGAGVYCAVAANNDNVNCNTCRLNCMDSSKACPSICFCYWFPSRQVDFLIPKN